MDWLSERNVIARDLPLTWLKTVSICIRWFISVIVLEHTTRRVFRTLFKSVQEGHCVWSCGWLQTFFLAGILTCHCSKSTGVTFNIRNVSVPFICASVTVRQRAQHQSFGTGAPERKNQLVTFVTPVFNTSKSHWQRALFAQWWWPIHRWHFK